MVLPDHQIEALCNPQREKVFNGTFKFGDPNLPIFSEIKADPMISPFNIDQVEPASYDVRLGNDFRVFERDATPYIDLRNPVDITKPVTVADDEFFLLHPGEFVLGVTMEKLCMPNDIVARIEGKSSIGRLGLMIHVTAGFVDPGFQGPVTLEMCGLHPLPLAIYPGELIAQISFHQMTSPAREPYRGRYQNASSVEASKYGQ